MKEGFKMEREKLESKVIDSKITNEVEGKVEAVFSVFNEMDSDGDVVMPNSIKSGYGDNGVAMVWAHDWKNPIGRGVIEQDGDKATFKGQFIMDTQAGKDAFNTVKAMGDLQQWSFGYEVLDYETGTYQKDSETPVDARYLKELNVWEVSPVLVGANQNTFTVGVKENKEDVEEKSEVTEKELSGLTLDEQSDDLLIKLSELLSRFKELTALRLGKEKELSTNSATLIEEVQDALQEAFQDLDTLLNVASPEEMREEELDDTTLLLETEKVLVETLDPEL
jgi:HK97 family phage prohead protease|tara:strand:- start:549 stop:1388 length:840 start_codon:yes stop_codon:yes gene_type:complete